MKYGLHKTIPQFSDAQATLILEPETEGERLQISLLQQELKRLGIEHSNHWSEKNNEIALRIGVINDSKKTVDSDPKTCETLPR